MPETDPLLQAAVSALAAVFLPQTDGDLALARHAAQEAILSYHPANGPDALLAAQAIAFGLAAIATCAQTITDAEARRVLSLATSLARSAEYCRRTLTARTPPAPRPQIPAYNRADALAGVAEEVCQDPRDSENHTQTGGIAAPGLRRLHQR